MELQATLVCSQVVGDDVVRAFRQLVVQLRADCATAGLTGVLLFDGEATVHLLEGTPDCVQACLAKLQAGAHSAELHILTSYAPWPRRTFDTWRAGYADHDALADLLARSEGDEPEAMIAGFVALCSASDCL